MIDEKFLKRYEKAVSAQNETDYIGTGKAKDLLALARLGLWARDVALPTLEFYASDQQFSTGENMSNAQKRDMDDYGTEAREALAAYPGEKE